MNRTLSFVLAVLLVVLMPCQEAIAYLVDTTIPQGGGCPQPQRFNLSPGAPLNRQWSVALPSSPATLLTSSGAGTSAQLDEIEQVIAASFGAWSGVTGTTLNSTSYPGMLAPLNRVATANACSNDAETNLDGMNTICFDQSSDGFTDGVLAFTRVIVANAIGATVGNSPAAQFVGQILDVDTLFRNDGQATFATPAALATPQGQGAYDLESLLTHELGHWFALDHSGVWRSVMFPFAPPPGQSLGRRPTPTAPDATLADDDRAGIRFLYPDPNDLVNVGAIRGRVVPANPFALADTPATSPGSYVSGIFGAQVVAVDAESGAVIAGVFSLGSCAASNPPVQFDGSFDIEHLPIGRSYLIYVEPLVGLATPGEFTGALDDLCSSSSTVFCTTPAVDTNFNPTIRPAAP
jgi:hypothetical protein